MTAHARTSPTALLAEPPLRALLRLAVPTTGVMSIAAISNVFHTWFVSQLGSEAIAAVSLVFPISLILTTLTGGGIGTGVSSAVARALGKGDRDEATAVAEQAFTLTVVLGLLLSVALVRLAPRLLHLLGGRDAVLALAVDFARVLFAGFCIQFLGATADAVLRAEGNVRVPAICASASLLSQIVLTPLCMFTLGLGIRGAPVATIIGQSLGLVPRLVHLFGGRGIVRPRPTPVRPSGAPLAGILRVGVPASIGTLVAYIGMMVLTTVMARFGTAELAAFGLGSRLDFLLLTLCYGTGTAVLSLVGLATGAGRADLVSGYALRAVGLMAAVVSVPAVVLIVTPRVWFGLFTTDPAIEAVGETYFRTIGPSYPFLMVSMTLAFAFQGLGHATTPLVTMGLRVGSAVGGALLLARLGYGADAVFVLLAAGQVVSAVLMLMLFARTVRGLRAAG